MRVRDLRWYILASVIIIMSYAALSFTYYLSIKNGMVEETMKSIALEIAEGRTTLFSEKIDNLYDLYMSDVNNDLVYKPGTEEKTFEICDWQYTLQEKFYLNKNNEDMTPAKIDGKQILIAKDTVFNTKKASQADEGSGLSDDMFYVYFQKDISGLPTEVKEELTKDSDGFTSELLTVRVSLEDIVASINDELVSDTEKKTKNNYDLFAFYTTSSSDTLMYAASTIAPSLNTDITTLLSEDYKNFFETKKVSDGEISIFNKIYKINKKSSVVSAYEISGFYLYDTGGADPEATMYLATVVPTTDAVLGVGWVIQQALILFFAGVIVMGAMLGVFILGTRRASQLLRADRHSTEATKAIVIRIDVNGKVIFTNQTFKHVYGVNKLFSVDDFIDVETNLPILETIKQNKAFECKIEDTDGNTKFLHLSPLYISRSYYLMGTEITQDYNRRKHLEIMSGRNEYTNIENSFMFANQFDSIIEKYVGYDIAFVEYNIHKYDEIIGVFGQSNFVDLLNEVLKILKTVYPELQIFHITDAKFMVIQPNTDINVVVDGINKILDIFQRPITINQNNIYVKTKVVVFNYKHEDYDASLVDADKKLTSNVVRKKLDLAYQNIQSLTGKDYIIYDTKMDSIILAAVEMEKDIEQGLINHEFQMFLQPQFDIVSNKIAGFEALIRWLNPKYKDKSPQLFIELAEQRGHMLDIGRFVITESFKLAKKLEPYHIHVSVNVSPVQLLQVGFVQQLVDEFQKLDLKKGSVAIEITETLLMGNFQLVTEKLKILRDKGFSIHLDDFGTGYSSMLYLKDLPVDTIKIDKEFTKYIETNKVSEAIVKTICNLGTSLDLDVICEGVETQFQSDMVKKFGCRYIQGYLIGKAMPYDEAVELIEKYANKR